MSEETKKCDDCLGDIPKKAKKCSLCGSKQKTKYGAKHLIAGLFIMGWIFWSFGSSVEETKRTQNVPDEQKAYVISQNFVETTLRSPSTAEFPAFGSIMNLGGGRYKVTSYVDAQNGFGGMVRSIWSVTLKHTGGDWSYSKNWELEELVVDGELIY